jgi:uncharacterized OB-fold protein
MGGGAEMEENRTEGKKVPALPDLFTWSEDGVHLLSARCGSCGTFFFPRYHEQHRPGCSRQGIEKVLLSKGGKLSSYTIQYYMPPPPFKADRDITPYVIGLVEFSEGIQIVGIVVDCPFDELKMGMAMETTTFRLYRDEGGQDIVTWAFQPVKT